MNTVMEWELDRKTPELRQWRRIIAFLGYDPQPEPKALGERLQAKYRELGIPRKEAARRLGMDENTLQRYEEGKSKPTTDRARRLVARFLEKASVR